MFHYGEAFVDIGANIGWHTLSLVVKCPDVYSYAFEPSKEIFSLLSKNIIANSCQARCFAKQIALSDKKGKATLKKFIDLDPMHASLYPLADYSYEEEEVEIDTLDSQAETFTAPIGIIKCDVEGSERDVLQGSQRLLKGEFGQPPIWILESNYETSGMANFFPWQLIGIAAQYAPYQGYHIRNGRIVELSHHTALRHGDSLILAIPDLHKDRLERANSSK
jgi:FkbM family methyltransferase